MIVTIIKFWKKKKSFVAHCGVESRVTEGWATYGHDLCRPMGYEIVPIKFYFTGR